MRAGVAGCYRMNLSRIWNSLSFPFGQILQILCINELPSSQICKNFVRTNFCDQEYRFFTFFIRHPCNIIASETLWSLELNLCKREGNKKLLKIPRTLLSKKRGYMENVVNKLFIYMLNRVIYLFIFLSFFK